jgi:hypothetical protein
MNVGCKKLASQVNKLGLHSLSAQRHFTVFFLRYNFQQRSERQVRFHRTKSAGNLLHST